MACGSCGAGGRWLRPSRCMPAATAPEVTSTVSTPRARNCASCATQFWMPSLFSPWPSRVSSALPILTTTRRALLNDARGLLLAFPDMSGFSRFLLQLLQPPHQVHDQFTATLAVDRGG